MENGKLYYRIDQGGKTDWHNKLYCGYGENPLVLETDSYYTIETTGAGDTFCACVLNYVLERGLEALTEVQLSEMLRFANAAASLITTRKGALKVMPNADEVADLLARASHLR